MAVDQNIVIKLHKSVQSNVEIAKLLKITIPLLGKLSRSLKKPVTLLTGKGKEENEVSAPFNS